MDSSQRSVSPSKRRAMYWDSHIAHLAQWLDALKQVQRSNSPADELSLVQHLLDYLARNHDKLLTQLLDNGSIDSQAALAPESFTRLLNESLHTVDAFGMTLLTFRTRHATLLRSMVTDDNPSNVSATATARLRNRVHHMALVQRPGMHLANKRGNQLTPFVKNVSEAICARQQALPPDVIMGISDELAIPFVMVRRSGPHAIEVWFCVFYVDEVYVVGKQWYWLGAPEGRITAATQPLPWVRAGMLTA